MWAKETLQKAMIVMAATLGVMVEAGGQEEVPIAVIEQGMMKGSVMTSRHGREFYAFRGVPFAEPPVGKLRFQPPVPAGPWEGVLDASEDGPQCIQKNYLIQNPNVTGQEDCLYLNVYTPKVNPTDGLLPVMVHVPEGGYFTGSGVSYIHGPQFLLDKDIVLVTFNYRLGAMGFLSTGTSDASGNAGLKDQVEAFRWVNKNIASFGGDPECVTIFGQSAGAGSVHLQMLSPLSRGLFHRAITQSGSALNIWNKHINPWPTAVKQGALLNCTAANPEELIACLQEVDAAKLVDSGSALHTWSVHPMTVYRPVIEQGPNAFLPDDPFALVTKGDFANVPWIAGAVSSEGIFSAVPIVRNSKLLKELNDRPNELFPLLLELSSSVKNDEIPAVWSNLSNYYFGTDNVVINEDNQQQFINLISDRYMLQGVYKSAALQSRAGHHDLYLYYFDYRGKYSYSEVFTASKTNYGVSHCDDLIYLFSTPEYFPGWEPNHPDQQVIDNLVTLWTNFAKHGKPTPETEVAHKSTTCSMSCTGPQNLAWEPHVPQQCSQSTGQLQVLSISAASSGNSTLQFCMKSGSFNERLGFWESLPLSENQGPYHV